MQLQDFKIWFDGFCSALDSYPTGSQWELLKEKINELYNNENKQNEVKVYPRFKETT